MKFKSEITWPLQMTVLSFNLPQRHQMKALHRVTEQQNTQYWLSHRRMSPPAYWCKSHAANSWTNSKKRKKHSTRSSKSLKSWGSWSYLLVWIFKFFGNKIQIIPSRVWKETTVECQCNVTGLCFRTFHWIFKIFGIAAEQMPYTECNNQ